MENVERTCAGGAGAGGCRACAAGCGPGGATPRAEPGVSGGSDCLSVSPAKPLASLLGCGPLACASACTAAGGGDAATAAGLADSTKRGSRASGRVLISSDMPRVLQRGRLTVRYKWNQSQAQACADRLRQCRCCCRPEEPRYMPSLRAGAANEQT